MKSILFAAIVALSATGLAAFAAASAPAPHPPQSASCHEGASQEGPKCGQCCKDDCAKCCADKTCAKCDTCTR